MKVSLIVYADFETMLKPIDICRANREMTYTEQYQKHVPIVFCYYIDCFDDNNYSQKDFT